jgi:hypothetical protein
VLDVIDGGSERSFRNTNDAIAYILRDETVVVPNDADDGNIDVRENVRWSANDGEPAQDHDEYGDHNKRVGPA